MSIICKCASIWKICKNLANKQQANIVIISKYSQDLAQHKFHNMACITYNSMLGQLIDLFDLDISNHKKHALRKKDRLHDLGIDPVLQLRWVQEPLAANFEKLMTDGQWR